MGPDRDTIVVIPTRFQIYPLCTLLGSIDTDPSVTRILIYDNGHRGFSKEVLLNLSYSPKITIVESPDLSIYQMWNAGWRNALEHSGDNPVNVAFLNDDCYILPRTLHLMAQTLRSDDSFGAVYPDFYTSIDAYPVEYHLQETVGTFGMGGMTGFCFMIKGELNQDAGGPIPYIDEKFGWWYGDDDITKQLEIASYKMVKIQGLPIQHQEGQSSKNLNLRETIIKDNQYFNEKYGEHRVLW